MAHIKTKPFIEFSSAGYDSVIGQTSPDVNNQEILKKVEEKAEDFIMLTKWGDRLASGFPLTHQGKIKMFLEPHPVVSFFSVAHQFTTMVIKTRNDLIEDSDMFAMNSGEHLKRTSGCVNTASIAVVFMFTSIETLLNIIIESHKSDLKFENRVLTKKELSWLKPEEKIKTILPQINPKCFHVIASHKYAHIKKLMAFRNSIMHFKMDPDSNFPTSRVFIENVLKFDYDKALDATRDFINYYHTGLIENCDCGKD